jgi:hypothetical protein
MIGVGWQQERPGGCRCLCSWNHRTIAEVLDNPQPPAPGCPAAAEPGLLLRIETPDRFSGPRPVCAACYDALVPRAEAAP